VAQHFGVSEAAISKARKKLNLAVVKNVALETAHKVVDKSLNAIDQLYKINEQANTLLDDLEQSPELKLKTMAEIRGQLKLQLEIFQTLYDLKQVQAFQNAVLEAIGEESPDARKRIIARLKERSALRATLSIH
jgi:hypothetical protein